MSPSTAVCSIIALGFLLSTTHADSISQTLDAYPDFSKLNQLLVSSGIDKLIDAIPSFTLLALNDDEIGKLSGLKKPKEMEDIIKAHVALDYYDDVKLRRLNFGQAQEVANLLGSNGATQPKQGLLKVTRTEGGIFFQSSGLKPSPDDAKFVDRVYVKPSNISILKVDHTIYIDGLTSDLAPAMAPVSDKNATAPVAEPPAEEVAETPMADVPIPDESIAPSQDAESPKNADEDDAADAKGSAGKVTFGFASLIMAASCIAVAL